MSRIFLSHSSRDLREAVALKRWLAEQNPPLANEIFLDVDPESGLRAGTRWKDALRRANARCEAVICLLSANWEASHECKVEYRTAENLNKQIFIARLDASTGDDNMTSEWQRCDLFGAGPKTSIDVDGGPTVEFSTEGLYRLRDGIAGAGIGAESFVWPPPSDPDRAPYRGWAPLEAEDAAVFFGRDTQILRALDAVRGMRLSGVNSLFVVLGPSGTGKSSFLRAGLLPRLRREDRRFVLLDIVRPERNALTGESGLAASICATRRAFGLNQPSLGEVKAMCGARDVAAVSALLRQLRTTAAARLVERGDAGDAPSPPTLVLPLDQAEELFSADAGEAADTFLALLAGAIESINVTEIGVVVAATIRTDRYEVMQTHPRLAGVGSVLFDELKPMPPTQFKEVIVGPAQRATESGRPLRIAPDLVDRLLLDAGEGADTLPMLALTLSRLYADYGATGELALSQYQSLGGMRRVVQTEIDEVLSSNPGERTAQLTAMRAAFVPWLATINPANDQPMRRVARWSDIPQSSRPLIDALVAKRLMVKDTRGGQTVVEVALESLLRQWDELAGWLRDERKDLKDADDLERSAAAWGLNRHNPAWLLEGSRLADATALANMGNFRQRLKGVHPYLNASHQRENQRRSTEEQQRQEELRAAQERAQHAQERAEHAQQLQAAAESHTATLRKRSRVMRAVLAGTAVVAVLALVASVFAFVSRGQAQDRFRQATSIRLTAEAQAMLAGSRTGGDVRAIQELLAARSLTAQPDEDALYSAVVARDSTAKIIPVGYSEDAEGVVVAWSPDGKLLATTNPDGAVQLFDAETGLPLGDVLSGVDGRAGPMAFSPDGRLFAAGTDDGSIMLWDSETREQYGEEISGHDGHVLSLAFSPDGKTLVSGADDGAQMWDTSSGRAVGSRYTAQGSVDHVQVSDDGGIYVTASSDHGDVQLWDAKTGQLLGDPIPGPPDAITLLVQLSPDGRHLAIGEVLGSVQLWDTQTRQTVGEPLSNGLTGAISMAFNPDSRTLAVGGFDKTITVWDVQTGKRVGEPLSGHSESIVSLAYSADGQRLASRSTDGTIRVWDTSHTLVGHTANVNVLGFSPDGSRLATGGIDGIRVWDVEAGRQVGETIGAGTSIAGVAFTRDGERLVSSDTSGVVKVWDAETGQAIGRNVKTSSQDINTFTMSPSGRLLASGGSDGLIELWDVVNEEPAGEWESGGAIVSSLAFSHDDGFLASATTDGVFLWDPSTGDELRQLNVDKGREAVRIAISNDGTRIAAGSVDSSVRIYDPESGDPVGDPLTGHTDLVLGVAYSPDDRRLVSGSADGTVRLWDLQNGHAIGDPLTGHLDSVTGVVFSPDGTLIASTSIDLAVRLWPATASPEDLCAKLTANMSQKQWREWVSPDIDYVKTCPELPVAPD